MNDRLTRELRRYWRRQLGLTGKAPRRRRRDDRTPLKQWLDSWKRPEKMMGRWWSQQQRSAATWWKKSAPTWLGGKATPQRRYGAEAFSPVVQTFLAGSSVRQATYLHRSSDPALLAAPDWPGQLSAAEAAIRAHILMLAEEIDQLRKESTNA